MPPRTSSVYAKIASDIIEKIKNGTFAVGTTLIPERKLMEDYNVERTTVRRALELVRNDGYIEKRAGIGSVVVSKTKCEASASDASSSKPEKTVTVIRTAEKSEKQKLLFIVPFDADSFVLTAAKELSALSEKDGGSLDIVKADSKDELEKAVGNTRFSAAIVAQNPDDGILGYLSAGKIPYVLAFCRADGKRSVCIDNEDGMRKLVSSLCENGHKNIAFAGSDETRSFERDRRLAFTRALTENGIEVNQELINTGGHDEKSGFDRFSELYRRSGVRITAVCAVNDEVAKGVINAAKQFGLDVPSELSVTGFAKLSKQSGITSAVSSAHDFAYELLCAVKAEEKSGSTSTVTTTVGTAISGNTVAKCVGEQKKRGMSDFLL